MIYSRTRVFQKILDPIKKRVQLMLGRAVLQAVNDQQGIQLLKLSLLKGEVRTDIEHLFDYGFTSNPPKGSEAICGFIGGNRSRGFALKVDDRNSRIKGLKEGETALYTKFGDYIKLKEGRIIEVLAGSKLDVTAPEVNVVASTSVTITSPITKCDGNFEVTGTSLLTGLVTAPAGVFAAGGIVAKSSGTPSSGTVEDEKGSMEQMRQTYNSHTHPENGDGGGTTSAPNQPMN